MGLLTDLLGDGNATSSAVSHDGTPGVGDWLKVKSTAPLVVERSDPPAGGGGLTRIAQTVIAGSVAATIDFAGIPATYETLLLELVGRGDSNATAVEVRARFNNDSGTNYDHLSWGNAGNASTGTGGATGGRFGVLPAATATAGKAGWSELRVPGYARTTFEHVASGSNRYNTANAAGTVDNTHLAWRSTAAINRLTIYPLSGNFAIGTVATLYGIT